MPENGKIKWIQWLVATLWSVLVAVVLFMGNVVRANDLNNRSDHEKIYESLSNFRVEQMRQSTILERIEDKL